MTDHTLARADELLTELVELVETARTIPMSSSCVVPREKTLDLLDELREVLPSEMVQARQLMAERDRLLGDAEADAERQRNEATTEAGELVTAARTEAHELREAAKAEQAELVSAATVHRVATEEAEQLRAEAQATADRVRSEADAEAARTRQEAAAYGEKLTTDARAYADRTLADLSENLHRLASIADNGRAALTDEAAPEAGDFLPAADLG